jgi:ABC-type molybdenum transport system ATPase subunit/photorepair protein PhrA
MKWTLALKRWQPDFLQLTGPVSVEISEGEVWRIRGQNAVGKTSLLKAIADEAARSNIRIFFLTQFKDELFQFPLTFKEILNIYGLSGQEPLLQGLDLGRQWRRASGGERTRLLLSVALKQELDLLILDEPEQALDGVSREVFRAAIDLWLKNQKKTLVYVSHFSDEMIPNEKCLLLERAPQ